MKELRDIISRTHSMPASVLDEFVLYWEKVEHARNHIISEPGRIDKYLYFTFKGVQKAYYLNNGKEKIISFTQPYSFSCAPESFLTQTTSKYYFECITDSGFYRMAHKDFNWLLSQHQDLQAFLNISLMNLVNGITDRFIRQSTSSIEMRFKDFMLKSGHLINVIPQKDIASYLNINHTNFSKLINKVKV